MLPWSYPFSSLSPLHPCWRTSKWWEKGSHADVSGMPLWSLICRCPSVRSNIWGSWEVSLRPLQKLCKEGLEKESVWGSSAWLKACHNTGAQSLNSWLLRIGLHPPLQTKYEDSELHSLPLTNWVSKWKEIEREGEKERKGEIETERQGRRERIRENEWVWWSEMASPGELVIFFSPQIALWHGWFRFDCTVHEFFIAEASYVFLQYVNIRTCVYEYRELLEIWAKVFSNECLWRLVFGAISGWNWSYVFYIIWFL